MGLLGACILALVADSAGVLANLHGVPAAGAADLPPYVVAAAPRPWEAEDFRAMPLRCQTPIAQPSEARPAFTAQEAGLAPLQRGSALVYHSPGRAELASQVVDLLERQHRLLAYYTDQPFVVLPVVVVGAEEQLPRPFGFWVDIDRVTCWKLVTQETELPLRQEGNFWADVGRAWLYHGTLHECCHHGTCFQLGLMRYRWFCEGLSDYLGALAAVCYSGARDQAHVSQWIEPVEQTLAQRATIDVLADDVWWAPGGGRLGEPLELAAYAASQYCFARLVDAHGYGWIARVLKRAQETPPADHDALIAMVEAETGETALRAQLQAVSLRETLAYLRQGLAEDRVDAKPDGEAAPTEPRGP